MACTRNKNTMIDYRQEELKKRNFMEYNLSHGGNNQVQYAGNGLLQGRIYSSNLANNSTDIESHLFGINSTNLVSPEPIFEPQFKNDLTVSNIYKKSNTIYMPEPLVIEKNQRPFY